MHPRKRRHRCRVHSRSRRPDWGPALRNLATPAQLVHGAADMIAVGAHPELVAAQPGDPRLGPPLGAVTERDRPPQQRLDQARLPAGGQLRRTAGAGLPFKAFEPPCCRASRQRMTTMEAQPRRHATSRWRRRVEGIKRMLHHSCSTQQRSRDRLRTLRDRSAENRDRLRATK